MVAFQDGDAAADPPVRQREARAGGAGLEGADPGDYFEGDACSLEGLGLLPAPAEDQGISALEAHHPPSAQSVLDHQTVDVGLLGLDLSATLAHGEGEGPLRKISDEGGIQQSIIEDHFCSRQRIKASQRDQVRTSRAGTDKADKT